MRKFLTVLIFVFGFCGPAVAGGHLENEKTPEKFLQYYFDAFNAQDAKKLDTVFATPFQRIRNGETVSYTSWREYINFEVVKKTGWKRSVINETEIVYDSDKTAVVRILFSRLDASDNIVAKAEAAMIIVKPGSQWKLATILLPESIPVSEEDN
ncbi:MAG: hypothetical protein CBD03_00410 [Rhizobiales bacterium TMED143]|jgi:hypothetical protein|nr:MAG: hypothetical protein CBD03_00410 [Rhizobiales bacterium TMED143]